MHFSKGALLSSLLRQPHSLSIQLLLHDLGKQSIQEFRDHSQHRDLPYYPVLEHLLMC